MFICKFSEPECMYAIHYIFICNRYIIIVTQQKRDGCYDNSISLFQLHVLLVVRRLLCKIDMYASTFIPHIITFSYDVYASFICDSIVIIIAVHPTHIPITHGFQGNKHVMDVNDPCL